MVLIFAMFFSVGGFLMYLGVKIPIGGVLVYLFYRYFLRSEQSNPARNQNYANANQVNGLAKDIIGDNGTNQNLAESSKLLRAIQFEQCIWGYTPAKLRRIFPGAVFMEVPSTNPDVTLSGKTLILKINIGFTVTCHFVFNKGKVLSAIMVSVDENRGEYDLLKRDLELSLKEPVTSTQRDASGSLLTTWADGSTIFMLGLTPDNFIGLHIHSRKLSRKGMELSQILQEDN